jgi:hypothetical protein
LFFNIVHHTLIFGELRLRGCVQNFTDWPPGARTANGTALCH